MTTRTFHDPTGKRFAALELQAPAAPRTPDCIAFMLELDTDHGPQHLGGGDLSSSDTIALLKVMQDGTGTFHSSPVNSYDSYLKVHGGGGMITFTVAERTHGRTIRRIGVNALAAREAWRDLKASLTEQFDTTPSPLIATELIRASAGGDASVRKFADSMLPTANPTPAPLVVTEPITRAEPIMQPPADVADLQARVRELEAENLALRQQVKERDQMIAFVKQRVG